MNLTLDLPDGWYLLPGDGRAGDPDRRWNANFADSVLIAGVSRFYHWAHITSGCIDGLFGSDDPLGYLKETGLNLTKTEYLKNSYKNWGQNKVYELLLSTLPPSIDEWEHEFEVLI